jgi:septal ring factor EnvC (AmiA/AmiB activator)
MLAHARQQLSEAHSETSSLRNELTNTADMFQASKAMNQRLTEEIRAFEQTQAAMNGKLVVWISHRLIS